MVDVRDATADDLAIVAEIKTRALREDASNQYDATQLDAIAPTLPNPDAYRSILERQEFTLVVAETANDVRGFGCLHAADGQIHAVFVSPAAMGEGVGTNLLEALERRGAAAGRDDLWLNSTLNARGFYARRGYATGERTTIGADPEIPVVQMHKEL